MNKKVLIIILLVVLAVAGIAVLIMEKSGKNEIVEDVNNSEANKEIEMVENTEVLEEINKNICESNSTEIFIYHENDYVSWNTYSDKELGFEIKYPNDWLVEVKNGDFARHIWFKTKDRQNILEGGNVPVRIFDVNLNIFSYLDFSNFHDLEDKDFNLDNWINKRSDYEKCSIFEINGLKVFKVSEFGETTADILYFDNMKYIFTLEIEDCSIEVTAGEFKGCLEEKYKEEKIKIIKSLKFTE